MVNSGTNMISRNSLNFRLLLIKTLTFLSLPNLQIHDQSKTRPDCPVPNPCTASNTCPSNSRCTSHWDRHECECLPGFVGDQCQSVCSLPNICPSNATCLAEFNGSREHVCACPNGLEGRRCEHGSVETKCPRGWFGQFGQCQRCKCRGDRGFREQCDGKNGRCECQEGWFLKVSFLEF